jgi:hypothetical protein
MNKRIKEIIVRYDDKQSFIYGNTLGEVVGELVRCKECKWRGIPTACPIDNFYAQRWTKDDDYCSCGERKESE